MADDNYGPVNDLQTALNNLTETLDRIQPITDFWNARKVSARKMVEAYRDTILASSLSDGAKADAIDRLIGVAERNFLTGAGAATISDTTQFESEARAIPLIVGQVAQDAADAAKKKLEDWTNFSLLGISLMGLVAIAGVLIIGPRLLK